MSELYRGAIAPKDWIIVGSVLAATVLIALLFFFVVHQRSILKADIIQQDINRITADLAEAKAKQKKFGDLKSEMDKTQKLVSDFEKRLPSTRELLSLVTELENMANEVNLRVEVTPMPIERDDAKQIQTIPFKVTAYGNFHQIAGFINSLERFERYLKISDLKIGEQDNGVSAADFTLSTFQFVQLPDKPAGTPAGAPAAGAPAGAPAGTPAAAGGGAS